MRPVPVVAARDIPYISHANRFQNLSMYPPRTPESAELAGTPVTSLPGADSPSQLTRYLVHVHGGAWRDPRLTSASIEPIFAWAFAACPVLGRPGSRPSRTPLRRSWRIP